MPAPPPSPCALPTVAPLRWAWRPPCVSSTRLIPPVTVAGRAQVLAPGAAAGARAVPYETPRAGRYALQLSLGPDLRTRVDTDISVCVLEVTNYGESLPCSDAGVALWWASSGWKVSRTRPAPQKQGAAAALAVARNETEARRRSSCGRAAPCVTSRPPSAR